MIGTHFVTVYQLPSVHDWIDICTAFGSLFGALAGAVAAFFAFKAIQSARELQKKAFQANLYDKRLKLFYAVRTFLHNFQTMMDFNQDDLAMLDDALIEAEFLLEEPTVQFLLEMRSRAIRHRAIKNELAELLLRDQSNQAILDEQHGIGKYLVDLLDRGLKEKFIPYLKLRD